MSIQMKMTIEQLKQQPPAFREGVDVALLRQSQASSAMIPPVPGVSYEEKTFGGCIVDVATPENRKEDAVIFYIHGGGFISGDPRNYRCFTSFLAKESGYPVYGVVYRLAPEHPFPAAPEDCYAAYLALTQTYPNQKIYLIGESAGATLVIVTALMARDRGSRVPDAVVAYAPGAHFDHALDRSECQGMDPIVDCDSLGYLQAMYCPSDGKNPYASPGYADFRGFPPLRIVWDADETLAQDGRLIAAKVKAAGCSVEEKEWQGTFHTFEMMPTILPEAREEVLESIAFLKKA